MKTAAHWLWAAVFHKLSEDVSGWRWSDRKGAGTTLLLENEEAQT